MEKVNKTRNGTAESAQSTPTYPWPTELHPRKLFVHACAEGDASGQICSLIQLETDGKQTTCTIPAHTKRDATAQNTMMMMTINVFQYYNALDAAPFKKTVHILATCN